ncbi:MAG: Crp/Fnr family transcriptional regulator [Advenella sp.]
MNKPPGRARRRPALPSGALLLSDSALDSKVPDLLARLPVGVRADVLALGRARTCHAGDILFEQGQAHNGLVLIQSGLVRSYYTSEDARELTLGYWSAGHFVGAPQMFGGGQHVWTSVAEQDIHGLWLPGAELRTLAGKHAPLAVALCDALVHKSQCYCALLQLLATHSMRVRLARLLSMLAARPSGPLIALSHGQLASIIGATRQCVSQTLAQFAQAELVVRNENGTLLIQQPCLLARLR